MMGSIAVFMCPAAVDQAAIGPSIAERIQANVGGSADDAMGAAVMVALMGLCSLVFAITRATAVRRTFATSRYKTDAELTLLQLVAQRQRTRSFAFAAVCVVAGLVIMRLPLEIETRLLLALTPALMLVVAGVGVWRLRPLLGLTPTSGVQVTSHGQFLYVARGNSLIGWVAAPPKLVARATSLPVAFVHVHN